MTYSEWIRTLPCGRCRSQTTPTGAHHIKGDGHYGGVAMKAPDYFVMPLCMTCHREFHDGNWGEDWRLEQRGILLDTLAAAFNAGIIEIGDASPW